MKAASAALVLACGAILSGCAYLQKSDASMRLVSASYMASGSDLSARAFVYGNRTILVFDRSPTFLLVKDEQGRSVAFERVGRHYRLSRQLQSFTAWADGTASVFEALPIKQASSNSTTLKAAR